MNMGFVWVQNIGIGATVDTADIIEIRDAADNVKCNLCVVHNVGEDVGHDGLDNGAEDAPDNNAEDGAEDSNDNPAQNGVENSDDNPAENGAENTDHNPAENTPDNTLEDSAALPTNNLDQADCGGDHHPYYDGVLNFEDTAAQVDHTDHNPTYAPLHVLLELAGDDSPHKTSV